MRIPTTHPTITEFYRRLVQRSLIHDIGRVTPRLAGALLHQETDDQPPATYDGTRSLQRQS